MASSPIATCRPEAEHGFFWSHPGEGGTPGDDHPPWRTPMQRWLLCVLAVTVLGSRVVAAQDTDSILWVSSSRFLDINSGWVVQLPAGPSDFLSVPYPVQGGSGNSEQLVDGLPITGVAVSVADFGSSTSFPLVGVFPPNLSVDPIAMTPDLASPIVAVATPPLGTPALFAFVPIDTGEGSIPPGTSTVHAVVQIPPGSTSLMVGGERATGTSAFTTDG